jgi:GH25 family lysozyme M1 (1,4-beta-N-acetylmuramidase)
VGFVIGARRGQLGLLAGLVIALTALLFTSASDAATSTRAKGLDVSNFQGTINWAKVAKAGYRFAFGKATEGTTYNDKTYTTNRNGSEAAGLVFGAYHFARPGGANVAGATASAIKQANHLLAIAGPQPGELPPVLDLEKAGSLPKQRLLVWTLAWLGQIYARTGVQPFLYTSPLFWKNSLGNSTAAAAAGTGLWIAHWTSSGKPSVPAQNWAGSGWRFWQWTNCVSVPGIKHCSDGDRMNGTKLASVAIDPFPAGVPLLSTPPTIVGGPQVRQLLAAVPGTWEGGKPLTLAYQWRLCDAAGVTCTSIPGSTGETYRPVSSDVGHTLKVVVTATSTDGTATATTIASATVSSAGSPPGARPANVKPPQIAGNPLDGQVLTTSVGSWTGSPTKFTYRWRRCNASGASCLAIPHATGSRRTLTPDDIGSTLSLVVTATGQGGSASATTAPTAVVVAAPLPPVSIGTQTVRRGVAGNVQTDDGRATVTWQPGAVPVGKTVSLTTFGGTLSVPGTEVALSVPGLSSKGFKWPLDLSYTQPQASRTVLGYSTDGKVYHSVPPLQPAQLPTGTAVGWYVDSNNLTHVLTRTPFQIALFKQGAWGDPTYTSPSGPALAKQTPFQALPHPADRTVVLTTRLAVHSQAHVSASVTGPHSVPVAILGKGSRFGGRLAAGSFDVVQSYRRKPGSLQVHLRVNARLLRPGSYGLRVVAVDPWGRRSRLTLRFALKHAG